MSDTNLVTPIKVAVSNVSGNAIGFVPYQECFAKKLGAKSTLEFTVDSANQALYYIKQMSKSIVVTAFGEDDVVCSAGSYDSGTSTYTDSAPYAIGTDGDKFVVSGVLPYKSADAVLSLNAGNVFTVKITNPSIADNSSLPSGTIARVTNSLVEGGYNQYTKSAFEADGSLIVILTVGGISNVEVQVKWEDGGEFIPYTFVFKNIRLGAPGEVPVSLVKTTITNPQSVTFTNSSSHTKSFVPYKQNMTFSVPANDSLSVSIIKPEIVMYYQEQKESEFTITIG